jgi:hypothetical protein
MSNTSKYIKRIIDHDPALCIIDLSHIITPDADLNELFNCLMTHTNAVTHIFQKCGTPSDVSGVVLAQYIRNNKTLKYIYFGYNAFTEITYQALAEALYVNTTLKTLCIHDRFYLNWAIINRAFVVALRLNPCKPINSQWHLYSEYKNDLDLLVPIADKSTPPSMLEFLLYVHLDAKKIEPKIH